MDYPYTRNDLKNDLCEFSITIPKDTVTKEEERMFNLMLSDYETPPQEEQKNEIATKAKKDAIEHLLKQSLRAILKNEGIAPLSTINSDPAYDLTPNGDIVYKVKIIPMPIIQLGDLSQIHFEKVDFNPTEEEIDEFTKAMFEEEKVPPEKQEEWMRTNENERFRTKEGIREYIKELITDMKKKDFLLDVKFGAIEQAIKLCNIELPQSSLENIEMNMKEYFTDPRNKNITDRVKGTNFEESLYENEKKDLKEEIFLHNYAREKGLVVTDEEIQMIIEDVKKRTPGYVPFRNQEWIDLTRDAELRAKAKKIFLQEVFRKLGYQDIPEFF